MDPTAWDGKVVADVMLRSPKTLDASATVGELRNLFENSHVQTALIADGATYRGAIERGDLPPAAPDDAPAVDFARTDLPSISPDASIEDALTRLSAANTLRLIVLDPSGAELQGLVCLNTAGTDFCTK